MKTYKVLMSEVVTYSLVVEIEDDESISVEAAAEEQFVQGDYEVVGQGSRKVVDYEEVES